MMSTTSTTPQAPDHDHPGGASQERARHRLAVQVARRRDAARQARATAWLAVLAVLAGFLVAFVSDEDVFARDVMGRLESGEIEALVTGDWQPLEAGDDVPFDVDLRVGPESEAVIGVRQGTIRLAASTRASALPGTVELEIGAALFEVDSFWLGLSPMLIARGEGAWRLDADVTNRVAVYEGSASAASTIVQGKIRPEAQTLTRLEEARVVADALAEATPLVYTSSDPWDVRLLTDLLAIDDVVASTSAGIARTYGSEPRPADFYEAFTVVDDGVELVLERFDTDAGEGFGPPAAVLVAVLVTRLIADQSVMPIAQSVDEVDRYRALGATWGLILARRDLTASDFTSSLDLSLRQIAELGPDAPAPAPPSSAAPSPSPSPSASPTPSPSPSPSPSPTPTPTEEPPPDPTQIPEECNPSGSGPECAGEVVDNLMEIIDELIPPLPAIVEQTGDQLRDLLSLVLRR